jgi:hypothetical protein
MCCREEGLKCCAQEDVAAVVSCEKGKGRKAYNVDRCYKWIKVGETLRELLNSREMLRKGKRFDQEVWTGFVHHSECDCYTCL